MTSFNICTNSSDIYESLSQEKIKQIMNISHDYFHKTSILEKEIHDKHFIKKESFIQKIFKFI